MKKILLTACALATFATTNVANADEIGVGLQYSFPVYGLSVKKDLSETAAIQGMINTGVFSGVAGRYIHKFGKNTTNKLKLQPFAYGQVGAVRYGYSSYYGNETETSFLAGVGGGLEFVIPDFTDKLKWTTEIGFGHTGLEYYDFAGFFWGGGTHYYFDY